MAIPPLAGGGGYTVILEQLIINIIPFNFFFFLHFQ